MIILFYLKICFDYYGNLYLGSSNLLDLSKNIELYQVNIDNKNCPYLEKGDYHIIDKEYYTLNKADEDYIYEDIESQYGENNLEFDFSSNISDIDIDMRNNGDVCALYDTYICNGDRAEDLIISSKSKNDSYYQIILNKMNNTLKFIVIGDDVAKDYKIICENDKIIFVAT